MILSPFSWLYGTVADFRNTLYEKGFFKSFSLGARTISVGNITFGGTGKTPFVAFVAEILAEKGEKVCILSRGYGRENPKQRVLVSDGETIFADVKTAGDEPFELANKLLGKAIIVADANRVSAANWAREKFGITAFVLDDAFQHAQAKRDLDVVLLDATKPFGLLREPLKNLKRADLIVITRANLVENISELKSQISNLTDCPIFVSENKFTNLTELARFLATKSEPSAVAGGLILQSVLLADISKDNPQPPATAGGSDSPLTTRHYFAFCALGNPNNFFEQLRRENFNLIAVEKFPDHHFYIQKDIEKLEQKAAKTGAEILLTTAKDAVKLKDLKFNLPCFVAESQMIFDDKKRLRGIIHAVFNPKSKI